VKQVKVESRRDGDRDGNRGLGKESLGMTIPLQA
jgi:hypothetical protein